MEIALVERCLANDVIAQRELFRHLKRSIHRTLYRIMGSNQNLPDLIQDSYLEVFRSLRSFHGRSKLSTWADTIAARVAYRFLSVKSNAPRHLRLVDDIVNNEASPESHLAAREGIRSLYEILDKLDVKYRIAYALHVIDGRPLREVASVTGVSVVAAKNRVWRARKMVTERAGANPSLRPFIRGQRR